MSHLSEIATEVRDLEMAKRAAKALGIPILGEQMAVGAFYGGEGNSQVCDLVFGTLKMGRYVVGLKRQDDGTYAFVADTYDIPSDFVYRFGRDFARWESVVVNGLQGHRTVGRPTAFLQEYGLQVAETGAKQLGLSGQRIRVDADGAFHGLEMHKGDVIYVMTGGKLGKGKIIVNAKVDGSIAYGAYDIPGAGCLQATKWLDKTLGRVTAHRKTSDFFHETLPGGRVVHQKVGG